MLDSLLVFDLETIPDDEAALPLTGEEANDLLSRRELLTNYHLSITNGANAFLRQPFHKIIALSILRTSIERHEGYEFFSLQEIKSVCSEEKDIVKRFFRYVHHHRPRLITFNGRTFDLPVLKYRAMVHGVSAKAFYEAGSKWENYQHRYCHEFHCDLLEALSDFGGSARIKMHEVCAIIGVPGKLGIDGSKVAEFYDNGKVQEICNYCETDVLNTYLIYLRLLHHWGRMNAQGYNKSIAQLKDYLLSSNEQHFKEFFEAWQNSCKSRFFIEDD